MQRLLRFLPGGIPSPEDRAARARIAEQMHVQEHTLRALRAERQRGDAEDEIRGIRAEQGHYD
jgi:hypothetical protein